MNKNGFLKLCVKRIKEANEIDDPVNKHYALGAAYYNCKNAASKYGVAENDFQDLWNISRNFIASLDEPVIIVKEENV